MAEARTETPQQVIEVRDYDPGLKSLTFRTREGLDATAGILNPGKVFTMSTQRKEMITLSRNGGDLRIVIPGLPEVTYPAGKTLMLPANTEGIQLEAIGSQVHYECIYIEPETRGNVAAAEAEGGIDTAGTAEAAKDVVAA